MPNNSPFNRGFKTRAENISIEMRNKLGLSKFASMDAFKLAENLAIPIFNLDHLIDLTEPALSILTQPNKFSAIWLPNEDGNKIIIHNNNHHPKRQQSNIMHELAHIICNHQIPDEIAKLCLKLNLHYYNKTHEAEAKFLGAALQISKPGLLWLIKQHYTLDQISEYFNASIEMVKYRINILGLMGRV